MSTNQKTRVRIACTCAIVAAACGSGTQPNAGEETFALQTLNESALPYDHQGLGCCAYLSGDLKLADGRYTMSLTARNRNTGLVFTAKEWGTFTRQLSAVTFLPEGFEVIPFLLDVGVRTAHGLEVSLGGEGPGSPDQFRAVFTLRE